MIKEKKIIFVSIKQNQPTILSGSFNKDQLVCGCVLEQSLD